MRIGLDRLHIHRVSTILFCPAAEYSVPKFLDFRFLLCLLETIAFRSLQTVVLPVCHSSFLVTCTRDGWTSHVCLGLTVAKTCSLPPYDLAAKNRALVRVIDSRHTILEIARLARQRMDNLATATVDSLPEQSWRPSTGRPGRNLLADDCRSHLSRPASRRDARFT